jgi:hypothetical protein
MAPITYSAIPVSWPWTLASDAPAGIAERSIRSNPAPGTWMSRSRRATAPIARVNRSVTRTSTSGNLATASGSSVWMMSQGSMRLARTRSAKLDDSAPRNATRSMRPPLSFLNAHAAAGPESDQFPER